MITLWMKPGGNRPPGDNLSFSISGTGSFRCPVAPLITQHPPCCWSRLGPQHPFAVRTEHSQKLRGSSARWGSVLWSSCQLLLLHHTSSTGWMWSMVVCSILEIGDPEWPGFCPSMLVICVCFITHCRSCHQHPTHPHPRQPWDVWSHTIHKATLELAVRTFICSPWWGKHCRSDNSA